MIPTTYQDWQRCITVGCRIQLTRNWTQARLQELQDHAHPRTREFIARYGLEHTRRVAGWFQQASADASS